MAENQGEFSVKPPAPDSVKPPTTEESVEFSAAAMSVDISASEEDDSDISVKPPQG